MAFARFKVCPLSWGATWGEDGTCDGAVLPSFLPIERFNPPHGLCVAHFSQVPLCGRKVGMAKDDLGDDFNRGSGPARVRRRVPSQIMGTETNANPFAGVPHDHPGSRVTYREDAILGCDPLVANVCFEAFRHLLGNEDHFFLPAAFRLPEDQPPVLNVPGREFQGFAHAQTTTGHHLHEQAISGHGNLEDDLIHGLLLQEVPPYLIRCTEELSQHGRVARILEIGLTGVLDEVEEGGQGGETGSLGRLLPAVGERGQEAEDFLCGEGLQISVREGSGELGQEKLIARDRIFFVNWPGGRKDTALRLFPPSWYTSFVP